MGHITEKQVINKKIKILPCVKCGSDDIEINDCGYSSFNVAWGKCKNCTHEVKISPCSWSIKKSEIAKHWNKENNPTILRKRYEKQIIELNKKIKALPKNK